MWPNISFERDVSSASRLRASQPDITRMRYLAIILVAIFCVAASAADEEYFDAHTIRASNIPSDAPQFEEYSVVEKYGGSVATPDVKSHPRSREFRTMIRNGAKDGPNFAGHYTIVFWGCGAGCISLALADAITGKVFHPKDLQVIDTTNVDFDGFDDELVKFKLDSKLLVVFGAINEESARRGISYFVWENAALHRIRFVHKPYE